MIFKMNRGGVFTLREFEDFAKPQPSQGAGLGVAQQNKLD
jgi:hypothetical protein